MTDYRTTDQKAADEAIRIAIEQHNMAYGEQDSPMQAAALTDYVVVATVRGFTEDGGGASRLIIAVPNGGDSPAYALVGLLETAKAQILHDYTADE